VACGARGYLLHRPATSQSPAAEGWVPAAVVDPSATKAYKDAPKALSWSKLRKASFSGRRSAASLSSGSGGSDVTWREEGRDWRQGAPSSPHTVSVGDEDLLRLARPLPQTLALPPSAPLSLSLAVEGAHATQASVTWLGPRGPLEDDTRFELCHRRDGVVSLHLDTCSPADLGTYTCVLTCVTDLSTQQVRCQCVVTQAQV